MKTLFAACMLLLASVSIAKAITPGQPPSPFVPRPPPPAGMPTSCAAQPGGTVWADAADGWRRKVCP